MHYPKPRLRPRLNPNLEGTVTIWRKNGSDWTDLDSAEMTKSEWSKLCAGYAPADPLTAEGFAVADGLYCIGFDTGMNMEDYSFYTWSEPTL